MIYKFLIILFLSLSSFLFSQNRDSVNNDYSKFNSLKSNSLKADWKIINSPLLLFPTNKFQFSSQNNRSIYSHFSTSQNNSTINFELQPSAMLKRFQLINNWEAKKRYGVFAKYLGVAQFIGAVGIGAVSIINQNKTQKKRVDLKNNGKR